MTKAELITALDGLPDDAIVRIEADHGQMAQKASDVSEVFIYKEWADEYSSEECCTAEDLKENGDNIDDFVKFVLIR